MTEGRESINTEKAKGRGGEDLQEMVEGEGRKWIGEDLVGLRQADGGEGSSPHCTHIV